MNLSVSESVKIFIGVVLFNQDEEEFNNTIVSLKNSFENLSKEFVSELNLLIKWNSQESFDISRVCDMHQINFIKIQGTYNVGFGEAHNLMMQKAFEIDDSYYLCLNPDGFLHPFCLLNLIRFSKEMNSPALIEAIQFPKEHPKPYDPFTGITSWCSGACLLISSQLYKLIGCFDKNIFMYCEDIDYSWRVRRAGFECYTCSSALFFHDVSEQKSSLIRKMMLESARYLAFKWSAPGFQSEMERQLIESKFYPTKEYLPPIKEVKERIPSSGIQEWRQLLSFSIPRW